MSLKKDQLLLSEFNKILKSNAGEAVINMDDVFPEKFDFFIGRYEYIMEKIGTGNMPPHKWSYHRIGLVTEGEAQFRIGMYRFTARKNTLVIIPARVITTSQWSANSKGYLCLFNLDFFLQHNFPYKSVENKKVLHPLVQPYLFIKEEQAARVAAIFEEMIHENGTNDPHKPELLALKIVELLILYERLYFDDPEVKNHGRSLMLIERFSDLLEQHFAHERSVSFYAAQLHVHPNYLNAVLKANTGVSVKESIQNRQLLEAKYLLHNTTMSVKEIAGKLGFKDPNYFTVFFKRLERSSPASYRSSFL